MPPLLGFSLPDLGAHYRLPVSIYLPPPLHPSALPSSTMSLQTHALAPTPGARPPRWLQVDCSGLPQACQNHAARTAAHVWPVWVRPHNRLRFAARLHLAGEPFMCPPITHIWRMDACSFCALRQATPPRRTLSAPAFVPVRWPEPFQTKATRWTCARVRPSMSPRADSCGRGPAPSQPKLAPNRPAGRVQPSRLPRVHRLVRASVARFTSAAL